MNHSSHSGHSRSLKDRLGPSTEAEGELGSNSRERPSALDRISEPLPPREENARQPPSFESGRLQEAEFIVEDDDLLDEEEEQAPAPAKATTNRVSAALRIGPPKADSRKKTRTIPLSPLSKMAGKLRGTKGKKKGTGSPRQGVSLRKATGTSVSKTRKQLYPSSKTIPCNKVSDTATGSKTGQSNQVCIPGVTRGGVDFRPPSNPLP